MLIKSALKVDFDKIKVIFFKFLQLSLANAISLYILTSIMQTRVGNSLTDSQS